jgi:hypothetical protein
LLQDSEVDDHPFLPQSIGHDGNLHFPVVTVQFLAFPVEITQSVGTGEVGVNCNLIHRYSPFTESTIHNAPFIEGETAPYRLLPEHREALSIPAD